MRFNRYILVTALLSAKDIKKAKELKPHLDLISATPATSDALGVPYDALYAKLPQDLPYGTPIQVRIHESTVQPKSAAELSISLPFEELFPQAKPEPAPAAPPEAAQSAAATAAAG